MSKDLRACLEGAILLPSLSPELMDENIKGIVESFATDLESESHRGTRTPSPHPLPLLPIELIAKEKKEMGKGSLTSFQKPKWALRYRLTIENNKTRMHITKLVDPLEVLENHIAIALKCSKARKLPPLPIETGLYLSMISVMMLWSRWVWCVCTINCYYLAYSYCF